MTDPEQVPVSEMLDRIIKTVADLEDLAAWWRQTPLRDIAAIPEPEWEPTDDMVTSMGTAMHNLGWDVPPSTAVAFLWVMHREGLL